MWIGTAVIMIIVIFIWLTFSNFGYVDESANTPAPEGPSSLEIFKNGLGVSIKEIQSLVQTIKEKVTRTNSFDVTIKESTATSSLNMSEASSTQENNTVATTTTNN